VTALERLRQKNPDSSKDELTKLTKAPSVSFVSSPREEFPFFEGVAEEIILVTYQRLWFDFRVADGTHTPADLRRAGVVAKPLGRVRTYALRVPGGDAVPKESFLGAWPYGRNGG
jgi:hypothetical protein